MMHLTIVAATLFEIEPLKHFLTENFNSENGWLFTKEENSVQLLITGVGTTPTAFGLGRLTSQVKTDLIINAGIAGSFNRKLKLGDVVLVNKDRFADVGVEEANGDFTDIFELNLTPDNDFPYTNGWLVNPDSRDLTFLPQVNALTVQKVHGTKTSIEKIQSKYTADIESMEGAAVHYAALMCGIPFFQIRSISNYVESRNKNNWNIPLAITQLNEVLIEIIKTY